MEDFTLTAGSSGTRNHAAGRFNLVHQNQLLLAVILCLLLVAGINLQSKAQVYYVTNDGTGASTSATDALNKVNFDGSGNTVVQGSITQSPSFLALDIPNNRFFVYEQFTGVLAIKVKNLTTGALISTIAAPSAPTAIQAIRYDPVGDFLYYTTTDGSFSTQTSNDALWKVKPDGTGLTQVAGSVSHSPTLLAIDIAHNQAFIYEAVATDHSIVTVNTTNGAVIQTVPLTAQANAIEYDPVTNFVYVLTSNNSAGLGATDALIRMHPDGTGLSTIVSSVTPGPFALALDAGNNRAFIYNSIITSRAILAVDLTSGTVSTVLSLSGLPSTESVTAIAVPITATVTTATPSSVTSSSATVGGNVTRSDATVTERGIVYSTTNTTPTTADTKFVIGSGTGVFSSSLTGLSGSTTYHLRAYAISSAGTSYGSEIDLTTLTAISSNANLSNLVISSGTLAPVFATGTHSYTATVANSVASITVTPTVADATATVKVNGTTVASGSRSGALSLAVGSNTITTIVTAQDGSTTATYTVVVTRPPSSDATLLSLSLSSGTLAPVFASGTMSYSASVSNGTTSITVTPTTNDATATVTVNGTTVASGTASGPVALAVGDNAITTVVTAQDGTTKDTYTVTVTRVSNDAFLQLLQVSTGTVLSHIAGPADENYTTSVGFATSSIIITPVAENANATITINGTPVASGTASGSIALNPGPTTIDLSVTAQDGVTVHTIELTVNRTGSSNAKLTVLQLSPGVVLTTISGPDDQNYAASVANSVSSVTITPTTADANASVTVNGTPVASGTPSNPIALNVGANTISLLATAQDGTTTRTFSVTVTRAGSSNATLSSLQISTGTALTSVSGPGDENFTTSVDAATTSLTITPTARDAGATITVNGTPVSSGAASGPIALNPGPTTITTIVTAQDGITTRSYIITVNRTGSNNARLSLLQVNSGTVHLTQVTNSSYTATVDNTISTVTVTPTTADANATVTVNGTAVSSGTASDPIAISSGSNTINLLVTAQDGSTTRAFSITVTQTGGPAPGFATYQSLSANSLADSPQLATDDGVIVHPGLSPNGDGINDYLLIEGLNAYPDNKLLIMNRSGLKVFETQNYDNGNRVFNGHSNINGVMQLPGTYFYTLDYNNGTEIKHKTGYIIIKY